MDLFKDIIGSVLETKVNAFDISPDEAKKAYTPFIVNRAISQHKDCIFYANEMNRFPFLDKDIQYNYYFHSLRGMRRRFEKWGKKPEKTEDVEAVKTYYGFSTVKAIDALKLLSEEEIKYIREKTDLGGAV